MTLLLLSALLLQTTPVAGDWTEVTRLPQNTAIRVRLNAGTVTGTFVSATPDAIAIRVSGRDVKIDRTSVKAVDRTNGKSRRSRNIGIGLFTGMGAGMLIYGATCGNNCMSEGAPVWTAPMSLIGAVAGAAAPPLSWQSVYRR